MNLGFWKKHYLNCAAQICCYYIYYIFWCAGLSNTAIKFLFSCFGHSCANDQTVKRDYDGFFSAFCILLPKVCRSDLQSELYTYVDASCPERRLTDDDRRAGARITASSMIQCGEHRPAYAHGQQTPCRRTCNMTQGHATSCTYKLTKKILHRCKVCAAHTSTIWCMQLCTCRLRACTHLCVLGQIVPTRYLNTHGCAQCTLTKIQ